LQRKLADASAVVTVSDYNLRFLRERYGEAARRVVRVYNGLDLELYRYSSPRVRSPRIVSVGRLVEKKGFGDLVAACSLLARQGSRFECDIIGAGPLQGELEAQIAAWGLVGRVRLLGPLPQVEVIEHLKRTAVFAGTYVVGTDGDRDGLPTVLVEAMALGTPVVAPTSPPSPSGHQRCDRSPRRRAIPAIALAIDRLLVDASLRSALADAPARGSSATSTCGSTLSRCAGRSRSEPAAASARLEIAS
jgi:glycosyltransferase involved in cell wall biosynthesis